MYAERNRNIKKLLERSFGKGKVTVRGHKGTARGWVTVNIDYTPRDDEHSRAIKALIWKMFKAAKIEIGTYGYDDPGSDYGYGSETHLNLNRTRKQQDEDTMEDFNYVGSRHHY
jgi:hypothetical protein